MPTGDPTIQCSKCGNVDYLFVTDSGPGPSHCSKCGLDLSTPPTSYDASKGDHDTLTTDDLHVAEKWLQNLEKAHSGHQTLVVNILGGPGSGKSTMRAGVFFDLKMRGIHCEEAAEYAKDLTWEDRRVALHNQIHIFGEQHHRIWRLLGQVDVVITDSPLLLTPIYNTRTENSLSKLALEEYNAMWNYTVLLTRSQPYCQIGRKRAKAEAEQIDRQIADYLLDNRIGFETAVSDEAGKNKIVGKILKLLDK